MRACRCGPATQAGDAHRDAHVAPAGDAWARPPPGAAADWPRVAILAAGVAFYVQAQFIPAADATSRYTLWILFALAERMRIAFREPEGGE